MQNATVANRLGKLMKRQSMFFGHGERLGIFFVSFTVIVKQATLNWAT